MTSVLKIDHTCNLKRCVCFMMRGVFSLVTFVIVSSSNENVQIWTTREKSLISQKHIIIDMHAPQFYYHPEFMPKIGEQLNKGLLRDTSVKKRREQNFTSCVCILYFLHRGVCALLILHSFILHWCTLYASVCVRWCFLFGTIGIYHSHRAAALLFSINISHNSTWDNCTHT